jgi:hypothetical protein
MGTIGAKTYPSLKRSDLRPSRRFDLPVSHATIGVPPHATETFLNPVKAAHSRLVRASIFGFGPDKIPHFIEFGAESTALLKFISSANLHFYLLGIQ